MIKIGLFSYNLGQRKLVFFYYNLRRREYIDSVSNIQDQNDSLLNSKHKHVSIQQKNIYISHRHYI